MNDSEKLKQIAVQVGKLERQVNSLVEALKPIKPVKLEKRPIFVGTAIIVGGLTMIVLGALLFQPELYNFSDDKRTIVVQYQINLLEGVGTLIGGIAALIAAIVYGARNGPRE